MKPVLVRRIWQQNNETFAIEWSDRICHEFRLSDVQKQCPCAQCVEKRSVDENVRAVRIQNIGRYALKITFTSGCSTGIYDFELLRKLAN